MYKNPVLFADYSDPDVIRVGDTFYMTSSSFNCTPGLPVLKSGDLVNWQLIGHGIKNVPAEGYGVCRPGCGVWAPAIRFHNDLFYIVFPMPDEGIYIIESEDPEKGWSEPHLLLEGKGLIDPCPFWDDDGRTYLVHAYAFSRAGIKSRLKLVEVSSDLKTIVDDGRIIVEAMGRIPTLEGPKMFKRDGFYYISAPAGGVAQGWQMVFRSETPFGPYEERTVLAQRGTELNGPHQGALVDDREGNWWFIHFQDYQPWGRIVHLQPARWENGWPLIGIDQDDEGVGKPVLQYSDPAGCPIGSEVVFPEELGLQWQWNANHSDDWSSREDNELVLHPGKLNDTPFHLYGRILCRKLIGPQFKAQTILSFSPEKPEEEAGITITGLESARLGIARREEGRSLVYRINDRIFHIELLKEGPTTLFVEMNEGGFCRFGMEREDRPFYIGPGFRAVEGRWIGARFGLYCLGGHDSVSSARIHSVRINKEEEQYGY